jgi:uncharacterized protein YutE (UPF0331/DUF86 family)
MADDVLLNKAAIIERCVRRVREEHAGDDANILANQTRQDSIVLNVQRACEAAIDLAMHVVRVHRLAVHDYQKLSLEILRSIVRNDLDDFLEFTRLLLRGQ